MVAVAGSGWKLAPCLVAMFNEADRRWPDRSRISDGSIGDQAHASRTSDHNPSPSGFVCAGDLTDDKAHGCDADLFAEHLRVSRDRRVKYAICNGRIFKGGTWLWTPYTGVNAHEKHTHVSVWDTPEARNDLRLWFPYADAPLEEDDMPTGPAICVDKDGVEWVFARGTDNALYGRRVDGPWVNYKGTLTSTPDAAGMPDGSIHVVARGTDGAAWLCVVTGGTGAWRSLGGTIA